MRNSPFKQKAMFKIVGVKYKRHPVHDLYAASKDHRSFMKRMIGNLNKFGYLRFWVSRSNTEYKLILDIALFLNVIMVWSLKDILSITKMTIKLIIYYQICNYWHQEKILNVIKSLNISDLKHGKLKQSILQPIKSHSMWVCHLQVKICWFTLLAFMIFEQEKSRLHIASRRIRNFGIITRFLNLLRAPRYWAHHHILTTWPKLVLSYNLF